ncbi:MAG: hypothetical protein KatS3mg102_0381 [Planctomycetota bacterium]|nr:MAG: hypothetical protein KatS3mg102_0381 [Planctomycetota bacterium]
MSGVSGVGPGSPGWEPGTQPAETVDPEAVAELLSGLRNIHDASQPWMPRWLVRWLDGDSNVASLARSVLADNRVTAEEVRRLVSSAYDYGAMQPGEKRILTTLLNEHAAKFEPVAREALAQFLGVPNPLPAGPAASSGPAGPAEPAAPTGGPRASDLVPAHILTRHGLDPNKMTTESKYEGHEWNVGYYPYSGDVQYEAFGKFRNVFGHGGEDGHAYFEFYSNPPSGLEPGSWIARGHIREDDFEATAGVDINGTRPVSNELYREIREAGAPAGARFAVLDANGRQLPFGAGDRLVPTVMQNGRPVETQDRSGSDVVWRIKRADGTIEAGGVPKSRQEVLGLANGVKFDFLDATGRLVGFSPRSGDRIVETFQDGERWHAFARLDDGRFQHQVIEGGRIARTETIDAAAKERLTRGRELIHRVQARDGTLKGDGKVGGDYNMGWWGKCHNVASLSTSNFPRPENPVRVVNNLERGETLALQYGNNVLRPQQDGGYLHEVREGNQVRSSRAISAEEAQRLAEENGANPVIVRRDGSLKRAEYETFTPRDLDALVAHIGDGAVEYKSGAGARYYGHPDILVTKDGRQIQAHIVSVKTRSGKTETIGSRSGFEFHETTRDPLRAPGMQSRTYNWGGRSYAFNVQDMAGLNRYREDDITELTVVHPDGREETIRANELDLIAWENQNDFRPDQLWALHKTVGKDGSTVIETAIGTQVWNYAAREVATRPLDPASLSASEREAAARPGMMTGSVGEQGKYYFETTIRTDGPTRTLRYWVRFDEQGNVADYAYLNGTPPDFVWTQHVRDPYTTRWTGESQAPGISNAEVQRLYLASRGAFPEATLPGGVIAREALMNARPVRPGER